ncbi:hypothetical protein KY290_033911 [Solanum tuberosum]|uniref:SNF2 N-terminal domain-containing protein n=1 Tax=Solanum tuberosum TaxID=4113 RepID=A0ABQ7U3I0_SOLTU|nr:hypothetical protein KY290_033911 [Solanum tuberosum]
MYPHRRGGFKFMWNNIAEDINLERLRDPLSESKGGCIILPLPVTRKTRLNIEAEFQKWAVDIPFHNLNNKDFSLKEDEGIVGVFHHLSDSTKKNSRLMRMVKMKYWAKSKSVLGISYDLFRILTREDRGEGHAARNEHNLVWKALKKVETEKHILLSVTPFQNNIKEMYNTLCVVTPKFATDLEQNWASLSSSIDKNV